MSYFVWLEYYCAAPVSKNVKSDELKYGDKHNHGQQPTNQQKDSLNDSLCAAVEAAYTTYNQAHPRAVVVQPTDPTIIGNRQVKTRSTRD